MGGGNEDKPHKQKLKKKQEKYTTFGVVQRSLERCVFEQNKDAASNGKEILLTRCRRRETNTDAEVYSRPPPLRSTQNFLQKFQNSNLEL